MLQQSPTPLCLGRNRHLYQHLRPGSDRAAFQDPALRLRGLLPPRLLSEQPEPPARRLHPRRPPLHRRQKWRDRAYFQGEHGADQRHGGGVSDGDSGDGRGGSRLPRIRPQGYRGLVT